MLLIYYDVYVCYIDSDLEYSKQTSDLSLSDSGFNKVYEGIGG